MPSVLECDRFTVFAGLTFCVHIADAELQNITEKYIFNICDIKSILDIFFCVSLTSFGARKATVLPSGESVTAEYFGSLKSKILGIN